MTGNVWPELTDQFNVRLTVPSVTVSPSAYKYWDSLRSTLLATSLTEIKIEVNVGWLGGIWVHYYRLDFHLLLLVPIRTKASLLTVTELYTVHNSPQLVQWICMVAWLQLQGVSLNRHCHQKTTYRESQTMHGEAITLCWCNMVLASYWNILCTYYDYENSHCRFCPLIHIDIVLSSCIHISTLYKCLTV